MENEIWRPVNGYEGLYEVSNYSRVRSLPHRTTSGKILKESFRCEDKKRRYVTLSKNGIEQQYLVYRLSAMAFPEICGEWFDGCVVNHKDGNPLNCAVENLEVCTQRHNMQCIKDRRKQKESVSIPVEQYSKEGVFIQRFDSIIDAGRYYKCDPRTITRASLNQLVYQPVIKQYKWIRVTV